MKKSVVAVVVSVLLSSQAYALNWGSYDTENKNIEGVVLLNYINGNYPNAGTLKEKLNPFKSKYKTFKVIKDSLRAQYDTVGNGMIYVGADYEAFMADNAELIASADADKDGNLNQAELDVLEAIAEEVENSNGSTFGCAAVTALGDKINQAIPVGIVSFGSLVPFRDKCEGL